MSQFAAALKRILDDTEIFSREDWSEILGVPASMIQMWVDDKNLPRASHLGMILTTLEISAGIPEEPLEEFKAMASLRATEVSPFGVRMLPTVMEYINRPIFGDLARKLGPLSVKEQEELLLQEFPG